MVTGKSTLSLVEKWVAEDGDVGTGHVQSEGIGAIHVRHTVSSHA